MNSAAVLSHQFFCQIPTAAEFEIHEQKGQIGNNVGNPVTTIEFDAVVNADRISHADVRCMKVAMAEVDGLSRFRIGRRFQQLWMKLVHGSYATVRNAFA